MVQEVLTNSKFICLTMCSCLLILCSWSFSCIKDLIPEVLILCKQRCQKRVLWSDTFVLLARLKYLLTCLTYLSSSATAQRLHFTEIFFGKGQWHTETQTGQVYGLPTWCEQEAGQTWALFKFSLANQQISEQGHLSPFQPLLARNVNLLQEPLYSAFLYLCSSSCCRPSSMSV